MGGSLEATRIMTQPTCQECKSTNVTFGAGDYCGSGPNELFIFTCGDCGETTGIYARELDG